MGMPMSDMGDKKIIDRFAIWWKENDGNAVLIGNMTVAALSYFYFFKADAMYSDVFCEGLLYFGKHTSDISLGRWMTPYCAAITAYIINPLFYLVLYFLCNTIAALVFSDLWGIKSRTVRILTGMLLIVSPAIVGQTMYIYEMMTYVISLSCVCASLWLVLKHTKIRHLLSAVILLAVAIGCFQANIGVVFVMAIGFIMIRILTDDNPSIKRIARTCIKIFLYVFLGIVFYWGAMLLHLKLYSISSRPTYAGADKISLWSSVTNALSHIRKPYRILFEYYRGGSLGGIIFWGGLFVLASIGIIYIIVVRIKKYNNYTVLFAVIMALCIPPAADIMDIIAPEHGLQLYWQYQLQLLAPLCIAIINAAVALFERNTSKYSVGMSLRKVVFICVVFCMVGLIAGYSFRAYASFRTYEIGNNHIRYYVGNALTHAFEDDARTDDMPIVFMGFVDDRGVQEWNPLIKYSYFDRAFPFWWDRYEVHSVWPNYCMYYFGVDIGSVSAEQYDNILNSSEFAAMEQYPSSKAYAVIDGCYVILLNRENVAE